MAKRNSGETTVQRIWFWKGAAERWAFLSKTATFTQSCFTSKITRKDLELAKAKAKRACSKFRRASSAFFSGDASNSTEISEAAAFKVLCIVMVTFSRHFLRKTFHSFAATTFFGNFRRSSLRAFIPPYASYWNMYVWFYLFASNMGARTFASNSSHLIFRSKM